MLKAAQCCWPEDVCAKLVGYCRRLALGQLGNSHVKEQATQPQPSPERKTTPDCSVNEPQRRIKP
eukprot:6489343-Amphidinium_carterae.1